MWEPLERFKVENPKAWYDGIGCLGLLLLGIVSMAIIAILSMLGGR